MIHRNNDLNGSYVRGENFMITQFTMVIWNNLKMIQLKCCASNKVT